MSKDIRIGWEIECYYNCDEIGRGNFIRKIEAINSNITNCEDNSLDCDGIEFQTPPQPVKSSLVTLKKVFDVIKQYGYTNEECGLHFNISTKYQTKYANFNPLTFCEHPLIKEIGDYFDRNDNQYCTNHLHTGTYLNKCGKLEELMENYFSHSSAINLDNWNAHDPQYRRIEVRILGNADYHKKYRKISSYTNKLVKLFNHSCKDQSIKL